MIRIADLRAADQGRDINFYDPIRKETLLVTLVSWDQAHLHLSTTWGDRLVVHPRFCEFAHDEHVAHLPEANYG